MNALFPDSFLAAIDQLTLVQSAVPARAQAGAHLSGRPGASLQFRDYSPYAQGDDLRRIDWNVYARTRHLFVRRFDHPTVAPVTVFVDDSVSMRLDDRRATAAARLAAAVSAAALAANDPVRLVVGTAVSPRPVTGRRSLLRLLTDLSTERPPAKASLSSTLEALLPQLASSRCRMLVVISDFFDDAGIEAVLQRLNRFPGKLLCLRVTLPTDFTPEWREDEDLLDCETGAQLPTPTGGGVLARYQTAYSRYFDRLATALADRGGRQILCDASADPLTHLLEVFPNGTLPF